MEERRLREAALVQSRRAEGAGRRRRPVSASPVTFMDNAYYAGFGEDAFEVRPVEELLRLKLRAMHGELLGRAAALMQSGDRPARGSVSRAFRGASKGAVVVRSAALAAVALKAAAKAEARRLRAGDSLAAPSPPSTPSPAPAERLGTRSEDGEEEEEEDEQVEEGARGVEEGVQSVYVRLARVRKDRGSSKGSAKEQLRLKEEARQTAFREGLMRLTGLVLARQAARRMGRLLSAERGARVQNYTRMLAAVFAAAKIKQCALPSLPSLLLLLTPARWWRMQRLRALIALHPEMFAQEASPLRRCMLRIWKNASVRRRRAAVGIVKLFLRHRLVNLSARLRQFRARVIVVRTSRRLLSAL